jgi:dethiobiotin synthetase
VRRLIVVAGTGTEIGKTHTTCALLHASGGQAIGLKPIESGVAGDEGEDGRALRLASSPTFHVKRFDAPYLFRRPVSPHLAAREEGRTIELDAVRRFLAGAAGDAEIVLVELAGGLFSPLAPGLSNAELAVGLAPARLLLVAPDRLGVLHDVGATLRALQALRLPPTAIALVTPAVPDASTGTNAAELAWLGCPPVFSVPRGTAEELAATDAIRALYAALLAARVT